MSEAGSLLFCCKAGNWDSIGIFTWDFSRVGGQTKHRDNQLLNGWGHRFFRNSGRDIGRGRGCYTSRAQLPTDDLLAPVKRNKQLIPLGLNLPSAILTNNGGISARERSVQSWPRMRPDTTATSFQDELHSCSLPMSTQNLASAAPDASFGLSQSRLP